MVKNLPAIQETQVKFLGWEDPPEKDMATKWLIKFFLVSLQSLSPLLLCSEFCDIRFYPL